MQITVIHTSNAEPSAEIVQTLARAGLTAVGMQWADVKIDTALCAGYVILSQPLENKRLELQEMLRAESRVGKPILGLGWGAKFLIEAGLAPGLRDQAVGIGWLENNYLSPGFMCLGEDYQYNAFTRLLSGRHILEIPAEPLPGSFIIPPGLLAEMRIQGLVLFQYCDQAGKSEKENIAGVSNKAGNVLALLPNILFLPAGEAILQSMRSYVLKGYVENVAPLHYLPR